MVKLNIFTLQDNGFKEKSQHLFAIFPATYRIGFTSSDKPAI
jgi:hypothetical protein